MVRGVLFITIDCLRADHVSAYGYDRATTPTIDRLAREGVLWENAFSAAPWTKPSVSSILTGHYPIHHGAFEGIKRSKGRRTVTTDVLIDTIPTLAETCAAAGWRCAAFINNAQLGEFSGLARGFDPYDPAAGKADRIIESFDKWIRSDVDTPALTYLHFLEAHWPYKPRRRHIAAFGGNRDTNFFRDFSARDFGKLRKAISRNEFRLTDGQLEEMIQMYDGAVRRLDGKVKKALEVLKSVGIEDEVAVFVTGDHGEEFMEHGMIGHGQSLYDELIHVPLVARVPGGARGRRRSEPVSLVDLPRTILATAGIEGDLPGRSLFEERSSNDPVFAELRIRNLYAQIVRQGRWKLHRRFKFTPTNGDVGRNLSPAQMLRTCPYEVRHELYDVETDPREREDLAADAKHRRVLSDLECELDRFWTENVPPETYECGAETEIDPCVVERLRDLGYIE
ncbi:MAG: sulfatase [Planctomycetes bacterium]|nr:sulfatase [Planctomycetota bacterium]